MGNVLVKDETLTEIADSIREKNGSAVLYKPAEMPEAIRNISASSDGGPTERDPIRFYGLEGKLLYSYSFEEIAQLQELPPLPEEEGLICQGWNWTLEAIRMTQREVEIGAVFITDDGSTRIYVDVVEGCMDPKLGFYQENADSVWVDWGDGSPKECSHEAAARVWFEHQYQNPGNYIIRLIPEENAEITVQGTLYGTYLFYKGSEYTYENNTYAAAIKKIELGRGIRAVNGYGLNGSRIKTVVIPNGIESLRPSFYACYNLRYFVFPYDTTEISANGFKNCYSLEKVIVPEHIGTFNATVFDACYSMKTLSLPLMVDKMSSAILKNCMSLKKIILPNNIKTLPQSFAEGCMSLENVFLGENIEQISVKCFATCSSLENIVLPKNVKEVGTNAFSACESLREIIFPDGLTTVGSYCCKECDSLVKIVVPATVTEIKTYAFQKCYGLDSIYLYSSVPPILGGANIFDSIITDYKIYIPKGTMEIYQAAEYWSEYAEHFVEMEE